MPVTLTRTISKIQSIPNSKNAQLVKETYEYLKSNGVSERHQHNALKVMIPFANYLGPYTTFFDINSKEQIWHFLTQRKGMMMRRVLKRSGLLHGIATS
jgi:hypothetical protein